MNGQMCLLCELEALFLGETMLGGRKGTGSGHGPGCYSPGHAVIFWHRMSRNPGILNFNLALYYQTIFIRVIRQSIFYLVVL